MEAVWRSLLGVVEGEGHGGHGGGGGDGTEKGKEKGGYGDDNERVGDRESEGVSHCLEGKEVKEFVETETDTEKEEDKEQKQEGEVNAEKEEDISPPRSPPKRDSSPVRREGSPLESIVEESEMDTDTEAGNEPKVLPEAEPETETRPQREADQAIAQGFEKAKSFWAQQRAAAQERLLRRREDSVVTPFHCQGQVEGGGLKEDSEARLSVEEGFQKAGAFWASQKRAAEERLGEGQKEGEGQRRLHVVEVGRSVTSLDSISSISAI